MGHAVGGEGEDVVGDEGASEGATKTVSGPADNGGAKISVRWSTGLHQVASIKRHSNRINSRVRTVIKIREDMALPSDLNLVKVALLPLQSPAMLRQMQRFVSLPIQLLLGSLFPHHRCLNEVRRLSVFVMVFVIYGV